jgi:hypothetical protein
MGKFLCYELNKSILLKQKYVLKDKIKVSERSMTMKDVLVLLKQNRVSKFLKINKGKST